MLIMQEAGKNSDSNVWLVPSGALDFCWDQVAEVMREYSRGLLDGFYTLGEVKEAVKNGSFDLWVAFSGEKEIECVALCQLEIYSQFKIYRISWAGGKVMSNLPEALARIEEYASKVAMADKIALDGRLGWIRALDRFGYDIVRFELWKPLHNVH